jgi:TolB-like protein/Tfp pilus assembly protein PilF
MSSLIPGYEYDIFISYRQNDNHSDKWVSNFVHALKEELEATIKKPISIYFDENPQDGLQETHQVDASLQKKLKCLVFIPIISQTYCDKNSYAWEHEFLPFIKIASEDDFGIDITLNNGNVVSRVLPIKIHDLDNEDQASLEGVLGGPVRSINLIYREAGVNRPLKPTDDRNLNLEKTDYQNQINKVANALKDIGRSILKHSEPKDYNPEVGKEASSSSNPSLKYFLIGLSVIIIANLGYWGIGKFSSTSGGNISPKDVTIAVLAFDDQSPTRDQEWLGDGVADEILNVLAKVEGLQVTGKTSSFSFKGKDATIKEIGEILNVEVILEGSVNKVGDELRITAQLIDVETDRHIWSDKYDRDASDIFSIMDEVAQNIARALRTELSIDELAEIKIDQPVNKKAYEHYLRGLHFHYTRLFFSDEKIDMEKAEKQFMLAISIDSTYAEAYNGLADVYDSYAYVDKGYEYKRDSVIRISKKINPNSAYLLATQGMKFLNINTLNLDSAFYFYKKAYGIDPNHFANTIGIVFAYDRIGAFDISNEFLENILITDPLNKVARGLLAEIYLKQGQYEEATKECSTVLEMDENSTNAMFILFESAVFHKKDINEAERLLKRLHGELYYDHYRARVLAMNGEKEKALELSNHWTVYSLLNMKKEALKQLDSLSSAEKYFEWNSYNALLNMNRTESLREEPKFKEILAKAKVVYDERMAKYGHLFDEE